MERKERKAAAAAAAATEAGLPEPEPQKPEVKPRRQRGRPRKVRVTDHADALPIPHLPVPLVQPASAAAATRPVMGDVGLSAPVSADQPTSVSLPQPTPVTLPQPTPITVEQPVSTLVDQAPWPTQPAPQVLPDSDDHNAETIDIELDGDDLDTTMATTINELSRMSIVPNNGDVPIGSTDGM